MPIYALKYSTKVPFFGGFIFPGSTPKNSFSTDPLESAVFCVGSTICPHTFYHGPISEHHSGGTNTPRKQASEV